MPVAIAIRASLIGAAAGIGLWSTWGSLDHAGGPDGPFRVAMLPSLSTLAIVVALCALAAVAAAWTLQRLRGDGDVSRTLDPLYPAAAAALLLMPYLPWLPDRFPLLLLLAGPGAWLWWGIIAGQAAVALVAYWRGARAAIPADQRFPDLPPGAQPPRDRRMSDLTPSAPEATRGEFTARRRRWTTAVFLASAVASGAMAGQFVRTPLFPGGDEPHYLVIAQSLWRDRDLRIENNHQRRDYDEYFHRDLPPHYLTRGVDGEIYSIHPVGLPVLVAPVYALAGYDGVVWAMVLLGATALTLAWRLAWALTGTASGATFGWTTLAFGVPWIFNTFSVYPEIPAAAATIVAFASTSGWRAGHTVTPPRLIRLHRFVAAGVALGALPWLSTKYALMAGALGLVVLARVWIPWPATRAERLRAIARTGAVALPCAISLAAWCLFFKVIWGTFSPAAPYGTQRETRLSYLPQGGPGLLFDQEYGIVLFAPALLMVLPGLWALWRHGSGQRRMALELVSIWAGLLAVVGAFHIWWGGSAIVGRPVIAAMPLLIVPMAAQWLASAAAPWRRAAQLSLLWAGLGLTVLVALAQNGLLLVAGRDGTSQVLEYLAPSSAVWTLLPTFLRQSPSAAAGLTAFWGVVLLGTGLGLSRARAATRGVGWRPGRSAAWTAVISVAVVGAASGVVGIVAEPSTVPADVSRRARVRLLDEFDDVRRPLAFRYTPLTLMDPAAVPPLFPLVVNEAGARTLDRATQLFGQRLSLPAGRYGVDLALPPASGPAVAGVLALQVGRSGPVYTSWDLDLTPPASWGRVFTLPVDVGFVGFKASEGIVAAGPQIRLTPQQIVPVSRRPSTQGVLGSGRYGDVRVFVHGEDAWPEQDGLWVRGRTTAELTVTTERSKPLTLDLRAGPRAVEVRVQVGSEERRATLDPGMTSTVTFPAGPETRPLRVTTSDGFIPADVEPGSRDRRLLGCWITIR